MRGYTYGIQSVIQKSNQYIVHHRHTTSTIDLATTATLKPANATLKPTKTPPIINPQRTPTQHAPSLKVSKPFEPLLLPTLFTLLTLLPLSFLASTPPFRTPLALAAAVPPDSAFPPRRSRTAADRARRSRVGGREGRGGGGGRAHVKRDGARWVR